MAVATLGAFVVVAGVLGLVSLYLGAVMLAGEGLRHNESSALADALGVLLDAALRKEKP